RSGRASSIRWSSSSSATPTNLSSGTSSGGISAWSGGSRSGSPATISYSVGTSDVEYRFPFTAPGFGELEGIAHRGDFDLTQHQEHSKTKLDYFDQERGELLPNGSKKGERYIPHCIEPAAGLDRGVLALICEAYTKDDSRPSPEFLKLHPRLAPIKAAVFPLVNKDGMPEVAE